MANSKTQDTPSIAQPQAIAQPAARPLAPGDHVYLIDGSGYIFRAYHALPPLTRPSDGLPVGAVHGFCQMLWKLLADGKDTDRPTHLAVIFDHSAVSFRNAIYDQYKANRPEPPEDLRPQFALIRQATRAFNAACIEQEGYEADDLIATYVRDARAAGADVTIISSDKDLMQLIQPGVTMLDTMKNRRLGPDEVVEKFGVLPEKVVDVQALAGDSIDNVPGVPGIGVKTAAQLIIEFGDLDTLLTEASTIKQQKRRENLIAFADQARLSRDLVRLKADVPVEVSLDTTAVCEPEPDQLLGFLREMEFTTLTKRIADGLGAAAPAPLAKSVGQSLKVDQPEKPGSGNGLAPADLVRARAAQSNHPAIDTAAYTTITTLDALAAWIAEARAALAFAFDIETTSLDAMRADLVGVSLAVAPGRAAYVPLAHTASSGLDFDGRGGIVQAPIKETLAALKPLLEDQAVLKIGQNLKYDALVLSRYGIGITPFDDTMLMSYAIDGGRGGHGMDELSARHLGHTPIAFKDVAGSGKAQVTFDRVAIDRATAYAAEDADVTLRLWRTLKPRLAAEGQMTVYETLERPLMPVIVAMERAGVKVDRAMLSRLSSDFTQKMASLEAEIYALAGEQFNLGSPKQLGDLLFGKMGLPGGKKTKTGQWETRANLLDDLANNEDVPDGARQLVNTMLAWRQLAKLKSTYTDALPGFIHPDTGRIHTSYALAATTTGRLASTDPNLQNIPVRTAEGREIRKAFIAEPGHQLISADYSQIELRVLAHIADIPQLKKAFADGLDIHAMTASEMFGVPIAGMDPMVRRRAKAINFGIIYGISAFGLANQLGISKQEAGEYIGRYFERFPGIRDYMEECKSYVRANGYVKTLFGRKIHYPDINIKNAGLRSFYERAAINAPIQGSAADIIRRAMIRMPAALHTANLRTTMLLQVHDELIFEAPDAEIDRAIPLIRATMERAPEPAVAMAVPLAVDAKAADNWEAAH